MPRHEALIVNRIASTYAMAMMHKAAKNFHLGLLCPKYRESIAQTEGEIVRLPIKFSGVLLGIQAVLFVRIVKRNDRIKLQPQRSETESVCN